MLKMSISSAQKKGRCDPSSSPYTGDEHKVVKSGQCPAPEIRDANFRDQQATIKFPGVPNLQSLGFQVRDTSGGLVPA
jgi:hypothetical protein